jgi:argininosuccinate lyase
MKLAHRHSTETGLLFQQEAKLSGQIADQLARIAEELVVWIVQETTELDFSQHLTATSGRRPSRSASPG